MAVIDENKDLKIKAESNMISDNVATVCSCHFGFTREATCSISLLKWTVPGTGQLTHAMYSQYKGRWWGGGGGGGACAFRICLSNNTKHSHNPLQCKLINNAM